MRPKNRIELQEYWDQCRAGLEAIYKEFGIEEPRCSSGIGLGWLPVFREAVQKLVEAGWDKRLAQVKQKFCQLRIYIDQKTHEKVGDEWVKTELGKKLEAIIDEAEAKCDNLCEVCGKERSKKGVRSGWALCDECGEDNPQHVIP